MEISPDKPTEIEIYSASVFYGKERVLENIINITNGSAATVSEQEILEWQIKLAECEGIFAEITASAIFAALRKMKLNKIIKNKETILLPITGFGLKDPPPNFS